MTDPDSPAPSPAVWIGPGRRLDRLAPWTRELGAELGTLARLDDLGALLDPSLPESGIALLDADELPLEDVGLLLRFLARGAGRELVLTGSDPAAGPARRLLGHPAVRWFAWPLDVEQLDALRAALAAAGNPFEAPVGRPAPAPAASAPRPLAGHLDEELTAIEAILREEEDLIREATRLEGLAEAEDEDALELGDRPAGLAAASALGLELTPEEIDAFLGPYEGAGEGAGAPAASASPSEPRASAASPESSLALELPLAEAAAPAPEDGLAPPIWYRAQVADLADLAQGLDLSLRALQEASDAPAERERALARLRGDVGRLVLFARTLGFLAAPPGPGGQVLALGTLLEEQLGGLAGVTPQSPRYLFRADPGVRVRSDKLLLVQAFDALLQLATACSSAGDVVRVDLRAEGQRARVRLTFPVGPLAGLDTESVLRPYGLRRILPHFGANALAAASRLIAGQGGRVALGADPDGARESRLLCEVTLPLALVP